MEQGSEIREMVNLLQGMREDMKDFRKNISTFGSNPNSSNNVSFNVQGGGIGFRVITTLCIVMFVMMVSSIGFSIYATDQQNAQIREIRYSTQSSISDVKKNTDRMQDYLNVILQWSSDLRKKVNQTKESK